MKMQKRRSLATTLRLSLLTGAGALGWMAIGASGASAADLPADAGLLGSVSDVVSSATAPVSAIADPLLAAAVAPPVSSAPPAGSAHGPAGPAPQVSQIASKPLGTVLTPVAGLVDDTVGQLPVVQSIVEPAPLTRVTAPVAGTVDSITGGVTQPVLAVVDTVVAPVLGAVDPVLAPVVDIVPPVVDVIAPVVDPIVAPVVGAVPPAVAPVVDVVGPEAAAPTSAPVLPPVDVPAPSSDAPEMTAAPTPGSDAVGSEGAVPGIAADAMVGTVSSSRSPSSSEARAAETFEASVQGVVRARMATVVDVAVIPALTSSAQALHDVQDISFTSGTFSGALSSITGAGGAAPLAALGTGLFLFVFLVRGSARRDAAAGLPSAPSFDPGSSPD